MSNKKTYHDYMGTEEIIKDIQTGKLTRDTDESYAEGFWDLAGSIEHSSNAQEQIYYALWEIVEYFINKKE